VKGAIKMKIGYVRTSMEKQETERQIRALKEIGCEKFYTEKLSGKNMNRPEFEKMLDELQKGDVVIVSELTRISRSTQDLFWIAEQFKLKGANLTSLKERWLDLSDETPAGKLMFTIMAGIAQFEREMMILRQKEGIAIAKEKGKYKGRVKKYTEKHAGMNHALELYKVGDKTVKEICEITKVSRAAFYRALKEAKD
jgi:DNA invertase Pin-like site-specific DNA recombinase